MINKECFIAETQNMNKQEKLFVAVYLDSVELVEYCIEELHAVPDEIMDYKNVMKCEEIAKELMEIYSGNKEKYN
jgi:hypothetical protein